jgi:cell division protease FtsH
MGVTQQMPHEEKYLYNREYLYDRICVILGGRAAEDLVFDTFTNGAENDLQQATQLARKMITEWGMSDRMGPFHTGSERKNVFLGEDMTRQREYSETTAREIDEEISRVLSEAYDRAKQTISENRKLLDSLADQLLEKEELGAKELSTLLGISLDGHDMGADAPKAEGEADTSEGSSEDGAGEPKSGVGSPRGDSPRGESAGGESPSGDASGSNSNSEDAGSGSDDRTGGSDGSGS